MSGGDDRDSEQDRKLFIGGLRHETTESKLRAFYEKWGELVDCVVMMDPHTRRSRGFGFVTYQYPASVDDALNNRPHIIDDREVEPKRATPREESTRSDSRNAVKKVFIGGISQDTDDELLREYFSKFGHVESASVMTDKDTGKSRGFGFVVFDSYAAADDCCMSRYHDVNGRRCEVKKAIPRQDESLRMSRSSNAPLRRSEFRGSNGRDSRRSLHGRSDGRRSSSYGPSAALSDSYYDRPYTSSALSNYAAALAAAYPEYSAPSWYDRDPYGSGSYGTRDLGTGYSQGYAGGPTRSSYSAKSSGPYGGGYGGASSYAPSSSYAGAQSSSAAAAAAYGREYLGSSQSAAYGGYYGGAQGAYGAY